MPELTVTQLAIFALLIAVGAVLGWTLRSDRCTREKLAVNAGWQEQLEAQQSDQRRLAEQNRKLLARINEIQASLKDARQRAGELTDALKQAVEARDASHRRLKDLRTSLGAAAAERDRLEGELEALAARQTSITRHLRDKDEKIFRLSRELSSWQARVPPLVARFRERSTELQRLRQELEIAQREVTAPQAGRGPASPAPATNAAIPAGAAANDVDCSPVAFEAGAPRPSAMQQKPPVRDDLKCIRGIGPATERLLNEFGIYRYEQIAGIAEFEIEGIARRLRGFRSRIEREDWVGQARRLCLDT